MAGQDIVDALRQAVLLPSLLSVSGWSELYDAVVASRSTRTICGQMRLDRPPLGTCPAETRVPQGPSGAVCRPRYVLAYSACVSSSSNLVAARLQEAIRSQLAKHMFSPPTI